MSFPVERRQKFSKNLPIGLKIIYNLKNILAPPVPEHITDMASSVIRGILLFNPDERLKLTVIGWDF